MILTTDRLTLRPLHADDVPALCTFYQSERSAMAGGNVDRFGAWKNATAMLGHWQVRGYGLWAVTRTEDDTTLGAVGPLYPDGWPETEIGWVLFDGNEGKGYATEAARAAIADARTRLGWTQIVHYIDPDNHRSIALAERLGATFDPKAAYPKPDSPCRVYRQPEVTQ